LNNIRQKNAAYIYSAYNENFNENTIIPHYIGKFNRICEYCDAIHFKIEKNSINRYNCCHSGKVKLAKLRPYPILLKQLITNRHIYSNYFREYIRNYNASLSFASMGECNAIKKRQQGKGPYCYSIQGQVYHCTSALYPYTKNTEQYAQLYILDPKEALVKRLQHQANKGNNSNI
jgi:hypothetical protein